jgi:integrase
MTPTTDTTHRLTVNDIVGLVIVDYTVNRKRSLKNVENSIRHLMKTFDKVPATADLDANTHISRRQSEGAKNSTINRELAVLRRGFSLAKRKRLIFECPFIENLEEDNVREGFAEVDEYEKVLAHLDETFKRIYIFGYHKGWRTSEVINIRRSWVDINAGFISLERRVSKNKRARIIALEPEVLAVVREAYAISEKYRSDFLFTHRNGRQISRSTLYRATKRAFALAGYPDRFFHDLRRTAYRNVLRATGNEKVAMNTTGHRSRSIADRYNIVSVDDMIEAATQVSVYLKKKTEEFYSRVNVTPESETSCFIEPRNAVVSKKDENVDISKSKWAKRFSMMTKFRKLINRGTK